MPCAGTGPCLQARAGNRGVRSTTRICCVRRGSRATHDWLGGEIAQGCLRLRACPAQNRPLQSKGLGLENVSLVNPGIKKTAGKGKLQDVLQMEQECDIQWLLRGRSPAGAGLGRAQRQTPCKRVRKGKTKLTSNPLGTQLAEHKDLLPRPKYRQRPARHGRRHGRHPAVPDHHLGLRVLPPGLTTTRSALHQDRKGPKKYSQCKRSQTPSSPLSSPSVEPTKGSRASRWGLRPWRTRTPP